MGVKNASHVLADVMSTTSSFAERERSNNVARRYVLPLIVDLHQSDLLPAILFCFDRQLCEQLAISLNRRLISLERAAKGHASSSKDIKKVNSPTQWACRS
jgi:superfamily II RNA helicase